MPLGGTSPGSSKRKLPRSPGSRLRRSRMSSEVPMANWREKFATRSSARAYTETSPFMRSACSFSRPSLEAAAAASAGTTLRATKSSQFLAARPRQVAVVLAVLPRAAGRCLCNLRLRTPCTKHGGRRHLWPCSGSLADNSFSIATRSKSSPKCLIRYSGCWPSGTGQASCDCVRPTGRTEHALLRAIENDFADLELVGHLIPRPRSDSRARRYDVAPRGALLNHLVGKRE